MSETDSKVEGKGYLHTKTQPVLEGFRLQEALLP
jgi:hypothetical protein